MKRNDIKALATKSPAELHTLLDGLVMNLAKARLDKKAGKLSNPRVVSQMADDIARVKTALREKELA